MPVSNHPIVRGLVVGAAIVVCQSLTGCGADEHKLARADDQEPVAVAKAEPGAASPTAKSDAASAAAEDRPDENQSDENRPGEDWPEFLGPRRDGTSSETGLLEKWPADGPRALWKKKIGEGYSAPSVRGDRLVLFHRPGDASGSGDEEVVECFEAATGKPIWRYAYPSHYVDPYGYNGGPRCTPLLTDDRCFIFGAEGMLTCLDLETGKRVWQHDTAEEFQVPQAFFGVGATPILEQNLLIVMVGGHPKSGVVAFDAGSGEKAWESVGPGSWPAPPIRIERDRPPVKLASYASPLAVTIHGKRHLLCFMRPGLVSLDPQTGDENFSFWFRSELHDSVNAARPVVVGDLVFLSAAYQTGAVLLKVAVDGKSCDVVWQDVDAMQTHWSTAIHHQGFLYGFSGRHETGSTFRCIELMTGRVRWQTVDVNARDTASPKDGRGTMEPKYYGRGSAILADGKFIVMGERGTLALVAADPQKFREISRIRFPEAGYPSWVAPVLSRKRLYLNVAREVRDRFASVHEYHLLCLDLAR